MPITKVSITDFLLMTKKHPVLDVRSPGEYQHGHIPDAYTLPLFSDEERKTVGTAYKQESREKAIKTGLAYFGKKMVRMVEEVETLIANRRVTDQQHANPGPAGIVLLHCWRGGMRSAGVAWLLDLYGFTVFTLTGGYKAYRHWVLQQFTKEYSIHVLGGYTGSGKTLLLRQLAKQGETIIDLEQLANHKGSAFGNLERLPQPSQEMFENELATRLSIIREQSPAMFWIEDESQRIGQVNIPGSFFQTIHQQQLFFLDIPFEVRLDHLLVEYGGCKKESLEAGILRIRKRLGGLNTKNAINFLNEDNIKGCFRILLTYYDKFYKKALAASNHSQMVLINIQTDTVDPEINTNLFLLPQKV
jgi:tRNA 2-selenouridine synthase